MTEKKDKFAWEKYREYMMDILDNEKIYEHILSFQDWVTANPWYVTDGKINEILNETPLHHAVYYLDITKLYQYFGYSGEDVHLKISKGSRNEVEFRVFEDRESMGAWSYKDGKITRKNIGEDIPFVDGIANPFFSEKFLEIARAKSFT